MSGSVKVLTAIFFAFIISVHTPCKAEESISSDSPGVINLLGYLWQGYGLSLQEYVPIKTDTIALDSAWSMIGTLQNDPPKVIKWSDEKLSRKDEKKHIADDKNTVSRAGKSLVIKPEAAPPITFKDWFSSGKGQADDEGRRFLYKGKIPNGFYRVEAFYEHDAPGSFFINPKNGRILYADNGSDTVALSPDGKRMIAMNNGLNPPFKLVVANMEPDNPTVDLYCSCRSTPPTRRMIPEMIPLFTGWHGNGFSLVLIAQQKSSETETKPAATFPAMPIRFSLKGDGWHVSTANIEDLERVAGFSCFQRQNTSK